MKNNESITNISQQNLREVFHELTEIFLKNDFSLELIEKYEQLKNKVAVANPYDLEELTCLYGEVLNLKNLVQPPKYQEENIKATL